MTAPPSLARAAALGLAAVALGAADPEVSRGLSLFRQLEYDRAVVILGRALRRSDLPRGDLLEGLEALAFSYTILEDHGQAEETFHRLLDLQPDYEVAASQSPRFREAFEASQRTWTEGRRVRFELDPDPEQLRGQLTGNPARVGGVIARTESGDASLLTCAGSRCSGERPLERFTIEVRDHRGQVLASSGPFAPRDRPPAALPWWAWVAIGAGVVGGGALVLVIASPGEPPPGDLGTLRLP